jgi:hypothetical protein
MAMSLRGCPGWNWSTSSRSVSLSAAPTSTAVEGQGGGESGLFVEAVVGVEVLD